MIGSSFEAQARWSVGCFPHLPFSPVLHSPLISACMIDRKYKHLHIFVIYGRVCIHLHLDLSYLIASSILICSCLITRFVYSLYLV